MFSALVLTPTADPILLQDDEITGLQIKYKEGWLPVKPIPNALVLNVGDVIEVLATIVFHVTKFIFLVFSKQ